MAEERLALMAHLLRRAGFGATREELEAYAARPYEEVVEELVHPERMPDLDDDVLARYYPHLGANIDNPQSGTAAGSGGWSTRQRPLEEKMALFWHHVFATGWTKSEHTPTMVRHIEMLRQNGLANFRTLLLDLSRDPAMIYWLDNNENHARSINENYGREILELFSMGIGNYSEQDIKECARAFTGWTFEQRDPALPVRPLRLAASSTTRPGPRQRREDVPRRTPATSTARTSSTSSPSRRRRPASSAATSTTSSSPTSSRSRPGACTDPVDPAAIKTLMTAFKDSDADIRSVMRVLFNSDFFKAARFTRVKAPIELVAGVIKLAGHPPRRRARPDRLRRRDPRDGPDADGPAHGRGLAHRQGVDRRRHAHRADQLRRQPDQRHQEARPAASDPRAAREELRPAAGADEVVDTVLDLVGPLEVQPETRAALVDLAAQGGEIRFGSDDDRSEERGAHRPPASPDGRLARVPVRLIIRPVDVSQAARTAVRRNSTGMAVHANGNGSKKKDPVLVVVQLSGGNDFMNTVIPFQNGHYYDARPLVHVARGRVAAVHRHPRLPPGRRPPARYVPRPATSRSSRASATRTPAARTSARWTSGTPASR